MDFTALGETFLTLVVIMDPVGLVPVFIAVTARLTPAQRRAAAVRAVLAAGALMIAFAVIGRALLDYLHVSVEALSISGGLLLLLVALEMLRGMDAPDAESEDVALVPLATPLVAGPGAIATIIVLVEQNDGSAGRLGVAGGLLVALGTVGVALLGAQWLARVLPGSFVGFLTRVFGLLLSAIGVQLVVDGVRGLV